MSKINRVNRMLLCLGVCASLSACAELSTSPQWDASFGDAYRQLLVQQRIYPDGVANSDAENGIDGIAAAASQDRYGASFKAPAQPSSATQISIQ